MSLMWVLVTVCGVLVVGVAVGGGALVSVMAEADRDGMLDAA